MVNDDLQHNREMKDDAIDQGAPPSPMWVMEFGILVGEKRFSRILEDPQ